MKKISIYSFLLFLGVVATQAVRWFVPGISASVSIVAGVLSMVGLSFIMIHVGYEFEMDEKNLRGYLLDTVIASGSAALPWLLAALYLFLAVLWPGSVGDWNAWKDALLAGRFAAPTATGVLFPMLAAAGLSASWVFRKTRILAVLADLSSVLLMIPLKIVMIGLAWQLGAVVLIMFSQLWLGWRWFRSIRLPVEWPWVLGYSIIITAMSEAIHYGAKAIDFRVAVQIEVLLPAFVVGCLMRRPAGADPHRDDKREGHQEGPESATEQRVSTLVTGIFMVLVGLSMPLSLVFSELAASVDVGSDSGGMGSMVLDPGLLLTHVLILSLLINVGKLVPMIFYRREASWQERLAVALALCPRGAVGAGFILLSVEYGLGGPMLSVAVMALVLNLLSTPVFIYAVKLLTPQVQPSAG